MSTFSRSGHWRRSANGGVHWVSSHVVSRDLWDHGALHQPCPPGLGSGHESYASFVFPNARCPVCEAPVFFYQSPSGGRVFFDELGPPWPKHGCTDNASPVTHRPGGTRVETWSASGWRPVSVKEVEWAEDAAIVRATLHSAGASEEIAFTASVADAEGLGALASVRWLGGDAGVLSTPGEEGDSPVEFPITRVSLSTTVPPAKRKALEAADARLFYDTVTADLAHVAPFKSRYTHGAMAGFRDGSPVLAVFLTDPPPLNYDLQELASNWLVTLVRADGSTPSSRAAQEWDRLTPPILAIGSRRREAVCDLTREFSGGGPEDVGVGSEAYTVSSAAGRVTLVRQAAGTTLDGQLQAFADQDEFGFLAPGLTLRAIRELARLRGVEELVEGFLEAMKDQQFKIDFRHRDNLIRLFRHGDARSGDALDLWLVYSCPRRGILVTLRTATDSPSRTRMKAAWPGVRGPDEAGRALSDAPQEGRISRWLSTAEQIGAFAAMLKVRHRRG